MSEWYEAAIATYPTRGGGVFVAPQYILDWDKDWKEGGSVPDFVALDFEVAEVVVVEVTTLATWKVSLAKVKQRERNRYRPIARKLLEERAIGAHRRICLLGFLRKDVLERGSARDFGGLALNQNVAIAATRCQESARPIPATRMRLSEARTYRMRQNCGAYRKLHHLPTF